jgi:hypothetical protein
MNNPDPNNNKLRRRMLPFLMKPFTLIVMFIACIFGEVMWMFRAIQEGNQIEAFLLFLGGLILGGVSGIWTSRIFDKYYFESLLGRINIVKTSSGIKNAVFTFIALGLPMVVSFVKSDSDPILAIVQSYIFGFICGMNFMIYLWARKLPE